MKTVEDAVVKSAEFSKKNAKLRSGIELMSIEKCSSNAMRGDLEQRSPNSERSMTSCVLQPSEVMTWTEEKCQMSLVACLDDTAIALKNASLILKVMVEKKFDTSKLPSTWVRAMLRIADGIMLPEVMRDFDGIARVFVARMPTDIQRQLCENPTVEVLTEFGMVKKEKIQNLNMKEVRQALDSTGPRSIEQQRQLLSANDEKPERAREPEVVQDAGTFEDAIEFFSNSKMRFGHIKELASLYAMIDMFKARLKRRG